MKMTIRISRKFAFSVFPVPRFEHSGFNQCDGFIIFRLSLCNSVAICFTPGIILAQFGLIVYINAFVLAMPLKIILMIQYTVSQPVGNTQKEKHKSKIFKIEKTENPKKLRENPVGVQPRVEPLREITVIKTSLKLG